MKLRITIAMDNAAFEGQNGHEAARILRKLAVSLEAQDVVSGDEFRLRDVNGNRVGEAVVR